MDSAPEMLARSRGCSSITSPPSWRRSNSMRGSPLARALIVFALLLCLAPVLWRMTNAEAVPTAAVAPEVSDGAEKDIAIELSFTAPPARVAILHLGKQVW